MRYGYRLNRTAVLLIFAVILCGCSNIYNFKPYDYKKGEDAAVKKQKSPYSLGLHGKRLVFKKELEILK